jgi:hypothetical protein
MPNQSSDFQDYAHLDDIQRNLIIDNFLEALQWGATTGQAVAISAKKTFGLTTRQWNSNIGSNAFAAAAGVLLIKKYLVLDEVTKGIYSRQYFPVMEDRNPGP